MADQIIYDLSGNFVCVQRTNPDGSQTSFGPGTNLWDDYAAKNGLPATTGTPTNKPARVPNAYTAMYSALKSLTQAQQLQVLGSICCYILVNNPKQAAEINAAFGLNLPFDQANP